jgi:putative transposase
VRKGRLSREQIADILKQLESGKSASDLAQEHGVSVSSIYTWRSKFRSASPEIAEPGLLEQLEEENMRLKMLVADLLLEKQTLKLMLKKAGHGY